MRVSLVAILLALTVTVAACGATPTAEGGFESPLVSAIPATTATAAPATPTPLSNPQPGKGTATGRFVDAGTGEPVADLVLYLGQLAPFQENGQDTDAEFVIMMPGSAPNAVTDREGRLAFVDVEPNRYVVVFWTPVETWVLTDTETQKEIEVAIEPGKIVDLETVSIHPPHSD